MQVVKIINNIAVVAQWQSTSLVMKRSRVRLPSTASVKKEQNSEKVPRL